MPPWNPLSLDPTTLTGARAEAHWAAQLLAASADTLLAHAEDDSHTNLRHDSVIGGLSGRELPGSRRVVLGLAPFSLAVVKGEAVVEHTRLLDGETLDDAMRWLGGVLGRDLTLRNYDMPDHPVRHGAAFGTGSVEERVELLRWFGNGSRVLNALAAAHPEATPVAIWPHHFDVGGIMFLDPPSEKARQIGFGLSPGDDHYAEPYFYVTPWPFPRDPTSLPKLPSGGIWRTGEFQGAIFTGSRVVAAVDQGQAVQGFLEAAVAAGHTLLRSTTA